MPPSQPERSEPLDAVLRELDACGSINIAQVLPEIYSQLRRLADGQMRTQPADHTLQATALVHEVVLRLLSHSACDWSDRQHVLHTAARAMRQILVDHSRRKAAAKRDGGGRAPLQDVVAPYERGAGDLGLFDAALDRLAEFDPTAASLVQLRFFAGLTMAQAAEVLSLPTRTAERIWSSARAWLRKEVDRGT